MKKKIFSIVMMLFLAVSVFLTGCKDNGLPNNPDTNATIFSNGGMSVVKGDYLYFVNGYVDAASLTKDDNKAGQVTKAGIYRTKLNNQEIDKDVDGFLTEGTTDRVVSKVVGFDKGGFYIYGDNIYYATPYMKLNKEGVLQNDRIEFHRIGIDGTNDSVVYTTAAADEALDWSVVKVGDVVYFVIYESSDLIVIDAGNGKEIGRAEDVSSYGFYEEETHRVEDNRTGLNYNYVYYTRALKVTDGVSLSAYKGNALCAMGIADGKETILERGRENTYTIKHVNEDKIYYTYTSIAEPVACLYRRVVNADWTKTEEVKLTNSAYDDYFFVNYGNDLVLGSAEGSTWKIQGDHNVAPVVLTTARTILGVYGDYAYYAEENHLIRFSLEDGELENAFGDKSSMLVTNSNVVDFDGRRVYVFNTYTAENNDSNYYLTYFEEDFENSSFEQRFVGIFEADDIPAKPEQPEPEYEGEEVEYVPHID